VAIEQSRDGSWTVDADTEIASPATWGTPLATYMARHALEAADARVFDSYIARANAWLAAYQPAGTFGSAVKLLALPRDKESATKLVENILAAQESDGGWGPRLDAPSEPFDSAIALLALQGAVRYVGQPGSQHNVAQVIARGRGYLIAAQERDGGWPETTRPPGGHSYAQHISTSGWATQALLVTDKAK
jgi:hypothetical protein